MEQTRYSLLRPDEQHEANLSDSSADRWARRSWRPRPLLSILSVVAATSLVVNAAFLFGYMPRLGAQPGDFFNQALYSPAQYVLKNEIVTFNGKFGLDATEFSGYPSAANNASWEKLYNKGISQISADEARPYINQTLPLPSDHTQYITSLSVFHTLHCLNQVRIAVFNGADFTDQDGLMGITHIDHCINAVRQSLMCNADITPLVWARDERDGYAKQIMAVPHSCRNFDAIHEWAARHPLQEVFDDEMVVEDDPLGWGRHTVQDVGLGLGPLDGHKR